MFLLGEGDGEAVFFFFFFFFFQSSGQLAFVKMYDFLQVMVLLKNAVCPNGICWNEKKSSYFSRRALQKEMSYASAMVVVLTDKLTLYVVVLARS